MDPPRLPVVRRNATIMHSATTSQDVAVESQQPGEESSATGVSNLQVIRASHDPYLTNVETIVARIDKNTRDMPARFEELRRQQRNQRALLEVVIRYIVFFTRALRA
jgi:hypothetical protein